MTFSSRVSLVPPQLNSKAPRSDFAIQQWIPFVRTLYYDTEHKKERKKGPHQPRWSKDYQTGVLYLGKKNGGKKLGTLNIGFASMALVYTCSRGKVVHAYEMKKDCCIFSCTESVLKKRTFHRILWPLHLGRESETCLNFPISIWYARGLLQPPYFLGLLFSISHSIPKRPKRVDKNGFCRYTPLAIEFFPGALFPGPSPTFFGETFRDENPLFIDFFSGTLNPWLTHTGNADRKEEGGRRI